MMDETELKKAMQRRTAEASARWVRKIKRANKLLDNANVPTKGRKMYDPTTGKILK